MSESGKIEAEKVQKYVFALDIGTRSVIGIVGRQEGDLFHVVDTEMVEHAKRAMIDGQIEDIEQVAKVCMLVKERLEQRLELSFEQVCVAAAGRALKTSRADFEVILNAGEAITSQMIYELEVGAIEKAHEDISSLSGDDPAMKFYCVGHSVIRYYLDDYPIATLLNHKGRRARVEVIATFLPNEVVESLYTAMSLSKLNIAYLTLEPIAAMNAVIPQELRLLNLALIDIGAGTSDVAISNEGSVSAYTMATTAGDELTETLIKQYLVDFSTAEGMKLACSQGEDPIIFQDILGFEYSVSRAEMLEVLRPAIEELAHVLCDKILECNENAPAAVFLVGGGSKIPLLGEMLADLLGIDRKKVAVGGNNYMKRLISASMDLSDPEYATPVGIALTAAASDTREGFYVLINGKKIRMFRNNALTVMDVLLMSGYQYSQLMGKRGKSITFELNGQKHTVRGGYAEPAQIMVNGVPASIATPVKCADSLLIKPSANGKDAVVKVIDIIKNPVSKFVTMNHTRYDLRERITINGAAADYEQEIHELDVVQSSVVSTLRELCSFARTAMEGWSFLVNGVSVDPTYLLEDGDEIISQLAVQQEPSSAQPEPIRADQSDQQQEQPKAASDIQEMQPLHISLNHQQVELYPKADGSAYLFLDMLNFVNIDPTKPQGNIILKINGKDAAYLDKINQNDTVEIYWTGKDEFTQ